MNRSRCFRKERQLAAQNSHLLGGCLHTSFPKVGVVPLLRIMALGELLCMRPRELKIACHGTIEFILAMRASELDLNFIQTIPISNVAFKCVRLDPQFSGDTFHLFARH